MMMMMMIKKIMIIMMMIIQTKKIQMTNVKPLVIWYAPEQAPAQPLRRQISVRGKLDPNKQAHKPNKPTTTPPHHTTTKQKKISLTKSEKLLLELRIDRWRFQAFRPSGSEFHSVSDMRNEITKTGKSIRTTWPRKLKQPNSKTNKQTNCLRGRVSQRLRPRSRAI